MLTLYLQRDGSLTHLSGKPYGRCVQLTSFMIGIEREWSRSTKKNRTTYNPATLEVSGVENIVPVGDKHERRNGLEITLGKLFYTQNMRPKVLRYSNAKRLWVGAGVPNLAIDFYERPRKKERHRKEYTR